MLNRSISAAICKEKVKKRYQNAEKGGSDSRTRCKRKEASNMAEAPWRRRKRNPARLGPCGVNYIMQCCNATLCFIYSVFLNLATHH